MNRTLLATVVSAAFAAAAPFAMAETVDVGADAAIVVAQTAPQRAPDASGAQPQAPEKRALRKPSERVDARLAEARAALKITDAQQPQWESFSNVLRKQARDMDQRVEQHRAQRDAGGAQGADAAGARASQRPEARNVSAIERLERRQQRMAEHSARLNDVIAAAKPLYAAFTPEQKQIADTMLARQGHGGKRHPHHRHGNRGA